MTEHQINPMRFCEQLYAVVVGLGLALGASQVVDVTKTGIPVVAENIPLFVAYLSFAFSLAQGAVRYLDLVYVERACGPITPGRAILDALVDGVRMWWLIVLSLFIVRPVIFGYVLIFVLVTGFIRSIGGRILGVEPPALERKLDRVNIGMLVVTAAVVLVAQFAFEGDAQESVVRIGIQVAALAYPVATYASSFREFFLPVDQSP